MKARPEQDMRGSSPTASTLIYGVRDAVPNQAIRADDLARAMVDVAVTGMTDRKSSVFENRDIRAMVAGSK